LKRAGLPVLLVANLLFFWPVLFHGRVFSSHDVVLATYPWRTGSGVDVPRNRLLSDPATGSETFLRRLPRAFRWNRSLASGAPGHLDIVQGDLSPFFWLPAALLPESAIETGILFLKFNAGFLFAWFFLRSRRFAPTPAAAGAAAWAWTSAQSVWWLWMHTSVSLFFPLLLWAVDRTFESPSASRGTAAAVLVFLGALAGGFPQWVLFGAAAAGLYFLFRAHECGLRLAGAAAARLAAAAALAAAVLLPAILFSARFLAASRQLEMRRGTAARYPMPLRQLRLMLVPEYSGDTLEDDYRGVGLRPMDNYVETAAGVGPFVLGAAGLALANRRRRRLTAYAALLGLGVALPLYGGGALLRIAGAVPGISPGLFERTKILIAFALSLCCASGVEVLEETFAGRTRESRLVRAIPFLIAVPLVLLAARFYPAVRPGDAVFRDTPGIAFLRRSASNAPSRFLGTGWTLVPNVAETLGLEDVRSHFVHEGAYRDLLTAVDPDVYGGYGTFLIFAPGAFDPASPVLDLLNVAAIAAPPGVDRPDSAEAAAGDPGPLRALSDRSFELPGTRPLPKIYSGPDLTVFARPSAFPRFFAVSRVKAGGVAEARAASREVLRTTAFVPAGVLDALARRLGPGAGDSARVTVSRYEAERFAVEVGTAAPVLLASSQKLFDPYWKASLDGARAPVIRCDGLFFGVLVPAGRHRVEGRFAIPLPEKAVSAAAGIALAVLCAAALAAGKAPPC
jgi:hypothetical protein